MRLFALAVLGLIAQHPLAAQSVPGRDLLASPLGLTAEPAAFGQGAAAGLWNPATGVLPDDARYRLAIAALNAPVDVAFTGQVVSVAWRAARLGTVTASITHAGVDGLVRTETDPQSIGAEIPYGAWVTSLGVARSLAPHLAAGAALRWQAGHLDQRRASRLGADLGVLVDGITARDVRVGASSFLFSPGSDDAPTFTLAGDARVAQHDSLVELRAGVGMVHAASAVTEVYPHLAARLGRLDLRGGPVHVAGYGEVSWRSRLAIALRQEDFTIAVVREANAAGLTPTFQISLSSQR